MDNLRKEKQTTSNLNQQQQQTTTAYDLSDETSVKLISQSFTSTKPQ